VRKCQITVKTAE